MNNLQLLRKQQRLSQADMAKIVNMSVRGYQNIEYGINEANYATLFRLADYFGCSVDFLLGHQTQSTLQLEGFTEAQRKIIELVSKLTPEQSWFALGKLSDILGLPYDAVKPGRPF